MKARFFIVFFVLFTQSVITAHPIHISITNIAHNKDSNIIKVSIRLFFDDFQTILNAIYNSHLNFSKQNILTLNQQQHIEKFIKSSFSLSTETGQPITLKFDDFNVENQLLWLNFKSVGIRELSKTIIENTLFLDYFTDQKNLVIYGKGSEQHGIEFNKRKTRETITL